MKLFKNNSGFSLLEFVTVLVIIMVLTSLAMVSLNIFRQKNRDVKRVTDIQDLQGSLEMYYRDYQIYPTMITFGSAFAAGTKIYIENLPTNPDPRNDGSCPDLEYDYSPDADNASYHIAFCLSTAVADLNTGINVASPEGKLGAGVAADYDTKLLLHLNNNVTDTSPNSRTVTNNSVTFSSATAKFGGYSGIFNGLGYLTVPDSEDWFFGADEFTIDFWFYSSDFTGNNSVIAQYQDSDNYWDLYADAIDGWTLVVHNEGTSDISFTQGGKTANTGTWYHVALVRNGDNFNIYQGGTSVASATDADTFYNKAAVLAIGQDGNGAQFMNGYLDEVRVSKGVARWTGNFTAPTAEY